MKINKNQYKNHRNCKRHRINENMLRTYLLIVVVVVFELNIAYSFHLGQGRPIFKPVKGSPQKNKGPIWIREKAPSSSTTSTTTALSLSSQSPTADSSELLDKAKAEATEIFECGSIVFSALSQSADEVTPEAVVQICDLIDETKPNLDLFVSREIGLRVKALKLKRYEMLAKLMKKDY